MDEQGDSVTLLGRIESHGRKFPWYLEKITFLLAIFSAILAGQWMWTESDWSEISLWFMTVCGFPFLAVFTAELVSRIIQKIHNRGIK